MKKVHDIKMQNPCKVKSMIGTIRQIKEIEELPELGPNIGKCVSYFSTLNPVQLYTIEEMNDKIDKLGLVTTVDIDIHIGLLHNQIVVLYSNNAFIRLAHPVIISESTNKISIPLINISPYDVLLNKDDIIATAVVYNNFEVWDGR